MIRSTPGIAAARIRAALILVLASLFSQPLSASTLRPILQSGEVSIQPIGSMGAYTGLDLLSGGRTAAIVRFSSDRIVTAARCRLTDRGRSVVFTGLSARPGTGLRLGARDRIAVMLAPGDRYPRVSFDLTVAAFDPAAWRSALGAQPFHFLALYLPGAEAWHQRGWLNATPAADPFPLLLDRHAGTPEISAFPYNRNWSYTPPLGAHPLPVIGLWAPRSRHYVGLEFQTTRLEDNSERDIATGYCWRKPAAGEPADGGPFAALVYPYGGTGYQQLVYPRPGTRLASHGTLLWSLDLPATDDPNRFVWSYLWPRIRRSLPDVPPVPDLSWLPGGIRLRDFEGPPGPGMIGGVEPPFQVPGTRLIGGWDWKGESPTAVAARAGDAARLRALDGEARRLLPYAKRFRAGPDRCVYWEKPLEGRWTDEWGGAPVTSLHNANGFAAGRLFLGLYRDAGHREYLPIVDGVFNWARHIAWTRNEFADVPSSPFAIGGTLSAAFCLEYAVTFRNAPDASHRARARVALDLARTFTYRYMVMWPSDNSRADSLDSSFLWEPNSGRDWTGAACANEVFWNLDTLAQTAVQTGDPILMWALQGSLDRWHRLYQDVSKPSLADYQPGDMAEGYGLYAGNVYGVGQHAAYGFASPLGMIEPVGDSRARVLAGDGAALVFNKGGVHTSIAGYRRASPGRFSFIVHTRLPRLDLSLTAPYTDLSRRPVFLVRGERRRALAAGKEFIRPPQALWSLYLKDLRNGDQVIVGEHGDTGPIKPSAPPLAVDTPAAPPAQMTGGRRDRADIRLRRTTASNSRPGVPRPAPQTNGFRPIPLPGDSHPVRSWSHLNSWAGLPAGLRWVYGVPVILPPPDRGALVHRLRLDRPVRVADAVFLAYSDGSGPRPALLLGDGARAVVDPGREVLAWRAWPPIYTRKLVAGIVRTGGRPILGIDPGGRTVWAMTAMSPSGRAARTGRSAIPASWQSGVAEWKATQKADRQIAAARALTAAIPRGSFAVIPPFTASPGNLLIRAGLADRGTLLTPDQLIDPGAFNARRFPVAVYLDGEDYLDTVHAPGDAAEAMVRYVREGGTLLLAGLGPFPMYYAAGPNNLHRPDPLPERLGLPIYNAIETAPDRPLHIEKAAGALPMPGLPSQLPYPPGDVRLRSIDRARLEAGASYTPLYTVRDDRGRDYGDAAGILVLPGGGRLIYFWGGLLRDPEADFPIVQSIARYLASPAARVSAFPSIPGRAPLPLPPG